MSFSVNTNIASLQAQNYLRADSDFQGKTINRVTSGLRIVNSGDDAAGLAIANGFRSDEAVLTQGIRNANDGLSTLQTIDGGMNNISQLLDRARTLATQSASGTFTGDRGAMNSEFQSVMGEIDRQSQAIGLNQNGQFAKSLSVFIGGGKGASSQAVINNGSVAVDLSKSTVDTTSLGLDNFRAENAGYDLGDTSSTSVTAILKNATNTNSEVSAAGAGKTRFTFTGAGFSDGNAINVDVNVSSVKDTATLVTAINTAIQSAANPTSASSASTAFKNAGITASIVTDANGRQQLAFTAPNAAFQVQAGDLAANAMLGNLDGATGQGATLKTFKTGTTVASTATGGAEEILLNGKNVSMTIAANATVAQRVSAFNTAIAGSTVDSSIRGKFTAVADGSQIRIENNNGDSFTIAAGGATTGAVAATKTDFGLTGTSTVSSNAFNATNAMSEKTEKIAGTLAVAARTQTFTAAAGISLAPSGATDSITITQGSNSYQINFNLSAVATAGVAAAIQSAIDGSSAAGKFTVAGAATLAFTATGDTRSAFTITSADDATAADIGIAKTGQTSVAAGGAGVAGPGTLTIVDTLGTHQLTGINVALNDDATDMVAALQAKIDADTGGLAGHYTAVNNAGKVELHAVDPAVTGDFSLATFGTVTSQMKFAASTANSTVAGGATGGSDVLTLTDANGAHALTMTVTAGDTTSSRIAALQTQLDSTTATKGMYTVSQDSTNHLVITSANAAASGFTITGNTAANADFGTVLTSGAAASRTAAAGVAQFTSAQSNSADSGGAQISTQYGDAKAYHWTSFDSGASQDITFSGNHSDGTQFSQSFTINSTTAPTLDAAVSQINTQLQASSDPSLQKIVAVKDTDTSGALGIRFMGSADFSVKLGSATTAGEGLADTSAGAINNGQGSILQSSTSAGAGIVDISNQTTAQQAVTALATAVTNLGNAQASVGKGENVFNFAVNLAQGQLTNEAAAESRIRDADLASEAANLSKAQILVQAGTAALAQANSAPQAILTLLRG
jgi:flagellin